MEDIASEEELGKNHGSNTKICGKEIKICGKSEGKQQKSEQNKEDSEQMIKDKKQFEENDRKDNNSGVSRNKDNENETNSVIQTAYHISKASKESSGKDKGSTDEVYQRKEKGNNRQGERKYNNYSQNETKVTERLRTRSIGKKINKSGDQLRTAQNSLDLEKKTNETRNVVRGTCCICEKHVKTGV